MLLRVSVALLALFCCGVWAQQPELIVQTGHAYGVNAVAFSPDGKLLASGSNDKTVKLWEVSDGRELRTLAGTTRRITSVAFSPDGKTLAAANDVQAIQLWDVASGNELRKLTSLTGSVTSLAFSPDGKTLASGSGNLQIWDLATGTELFRLTEFEDITSVAFSPDGRTLATGTDYFKGGLKLWDLATRKQIRALGNHSKTVTSVAFSPDGKLLASGSEDKTIRLWNPATGAELRVLSGHSLWITSVAFSPDGAKLASAGGQRALVGAELVKDGELKIWDVATGRELHTQTRMPPSVTSVAFSPDGKILASGTDDFPAGTGEIKFWDVSTGNRIQALARRARSVHSLAFSPDGKLLASGGVENSKGGVRLWDIARGSQLRNLTRPATVKTAIDFSPDGKILAIGATIPDRDPLMNSDRNGGIALLDVAQGMEIRAFVTHPVWCLAFSPDGKFVATGSTDNTIKFWDLQTGKELRKLVGSASYITALAFSPDGKILASASEAYVVRLWDVAAGKELRKLNEVRGRVNALSFSPDGRTLMIGSEDFIDGGEGGTIKLWDVLTDRQIRAFETQAHPILAVTFSPDGKTVASADRDSTVKIWEAATGNELVKLIAIGEQDWLVVTPDGLFDGSPAAWYQMLWRFSPEVVPVEAFFNEFFYPGLLAEVLSGSRPKASQNISQKDRRQPRLQLTLAGARTASGAGIASRNVNVAVAVEELPADRNHTKGSGVRDVRLFRNGSLVKAWRGKIRLENGKAELSATISITSGENRLTAYAFNEDNVKSGDAELVINGAGSLKRSGTAYLLAIGINRYANSYLNLNYAVADARAFAEEFKRQQTMLGRYAQVEIVSLFNQDATKDNFLHLLKRLAGEVESAPAAVAQNLKERFQRIKAAEPEDTVIAYFAGHGKATKEGRFYLIPYEFDYRSRSGGLDETGMQGILARSVSDLELEEILEKVNAEQLLLIVDACNSGQALEAEEKRRGPMNSKGLAQLAYEKGMYVLTAAQGHQAAKEVAELGHGLLTYALVEEGLKTSLPDKNPRDGEVRLREWLDFATERVPEMQLQKIKEAQGRNLKLAFVDGEEIRAAEKRNLQHPRVFYRRQLEAHELVVARPNVLSPQRR